MNTKFKLDKPRMRNDRQGAMLIFIGVVFVVLFIAAAFAIDVARIHVTRSELRTATDAAAKAAVEAFGREQSIEAGTQAALAIAQRNIVAGNGLDLDPSNIVFGGSLRQDDGSFAFDPDAEFINSARVVGTRTAASPDGSVGLFFAPIFGVDNFEPVQTATATRTERDIAMVLDVSGSMGTNGRFEALRNGVSVFLQELDATRQRERLSLSVYSSTARKRVDVTEDLQQIRDAFALESPQGRTAIGLGLELGIDSILNDPGVRPFALKSIVLMTDGNQNTDISPELVAPLAANEGIVVHTITFTQGANQQLMQEVADITSGIHVHAENNQQLEDAFREIARQLSVVLIE